MHGFAANPLRIAALDSEHCVRCGESVSLVVARRTRTNNRKVVGSKHAKVVCITVLTGNRLG